MADSIRSIKENSMRGRLIAGFVFATSLAVALQTHAVAQQRGQQPAGLTEKQWLESKEAKSHVAAAMAIAKPVLLQEAANLCSARGPQRPAVLRQEAGLPPVPRETLEPTRIFDNLYYIGFDTVGAWALTTSQGIIVIDSLNTPEEGEKVLIPGMQKAGLDPKQIKYVIIGHGHFDHFGGKPYTAFMPSGGFGAPDRQSLAALERAIDLAKKQKAVALLSGHPGIYGNTLAWMETRRKNPNSPNPFIYGEERFARYLNIADECTKARLIATEQKQ